jgi:hypothetical protein
MPSQAVDHAVARVAAEDMTEEATPGDEMAWRALRAAVIGVFVCPPVLNFYSGWVLLRLAVGGKSLSRRGSRCFFFAVLVDLAACFLAGWFLSLIRWR